MYFIFCCRYSCLIFLSWHFFNSVVYCHWQWGCFTALILAFYQRNLKWSTLTLTCCHVNIYCQLKQISVWKRKDHSHNKLMTVYIFYICIWVLRCLYNLICIFFLFWEKTFSYNIFWIYFSFQLLLFSPHFPSYFDP